MRDVFCGLLKWKEISGTKGNPIAEDAGSFRGSSSLLCGIYDLTEQNEADRFKTYYFNLEHNIELY